MTNKIENIIHFINGEPNIAEMTYVLSNTGFRPLTGATVDTLPIGAVVLLYNSQNHALLPIVICQHYFRGFSYMLFEELNNDPDICNLDCVRDFDNFMYKVIFQLPNAEPNPGKDILNKAFADMGFKPLSEATPDDLPQGGIALVTLNNSTLCPVIVRVLSLENRRFLYISQNHITAGNWHPNVIMDEFKPFKNFSYLVIS